MYSSTAWNKRISFFLFYILILNAGYTQDIVSLSGANTPHDDINPVWIGEGILLFTRTNHPENIGGLDDLGDIWMTTQSPDGVWSEAIHRRDLSTAGLDLALGMESRLILLVYHSGDEEKGVFQYSKFGKEWNFLRKVSLDGIAEFNNQLLGSASTGGEYIFISGKKIDSSENEDIYYSKKTAPGQWSRPTNLGSVINTSGQETAPYFDLKTGLLYFSSNFHPGAEGKDVFVSKILSDDDPVQWSIPQKWEFISSPGSESGVTFISPSKVVWTTTQNSDGFADLVTFKKAESLGIPENYQAPSDQEITQSKSEESTTVQELAPIYPANTVGIPEVKLQNKTIDVEEKPLRWLVIDQKNKIRLEDFRIFGKIDGTWNLIQSRDQKLSELKSSGVKILKFEVSRFFPTSISIDELKAGEPNVILMTKAESGNSLLLDKVNFKRATADLEDGDTFDYLDQIVGFLSENPDLKIRISGHTDSAGDPALNKALSLERAGAVRDYLVDKGVAFERLRISGWGGTRPIASNATEIGRSKNRRVEITIED